MAKLQDFKKEVPLLVELSLLAVKQGDEESAKKMLNAIGVLDPQNSAKKMGFGVIALHKMDVKMAQKHFVEILSGEPNNYRAQAFLSFAHILSVFQEGLTIDEKVNHLRQGAELAAQVVKKCTEESTRNLAQSLLDWEKELQEKADEHPPLH